MSFENKVIWITGASSGIGRALAMEFAKRKARLLISGRRKEALEELRTLLEAQNVECKLLLFDLSKPEEVVSAAEKWKKFYPRIDVLINNGGVSQRSLTVETALEVDRRVMEINFFSAVILTKAVLPGMIERKSGHVVAISSVVGKFGFSLRSAYSASKHALHGFFESLAIENQKNNISVTVVCPGRVKTNVSVNALTHDGTAYGKMDEGQEKGMPVDACASSIVKAMIANKKEVYIGKKEVIMIYLKRFIPSLFYKIASRVSAT